MVVLAQVFPFSIEAFIPIITSVLFSTLTIWISAQIIVSHGRFQDSLLFAIVSYVVLILMRFISIPYIPFVSTSIIIEVVIKSLLAMKLFHTDFRGGISLAGVQILIGMMITLPF